MSELFEEMHIGSMRARNRIVRAATAESLCTVEGAPSKRMTALYRELATGRVGTIITGYAYVCPDGKPSERSLNLGEDSLCDELRALTTEVHEACRVEKKPETTLKVPSLDDLRKGAKVEKLPTEPELLDEQVDACIVAQLVYGGSKSKLAADDLRWLQVEEVAGAHAAPQPTADIVGPSAIKHPATGIVPREADKQDIERICNAFALAAARAQRCGFDGVEVHAAHGYLLSQFLDGRFNKRTDEYGGTLAGRARFAVECVKAVREQVGPDFPIFVKLNSNDALNDPTGANGGLSQDESMQVAEMLVEAGANCIDVSGDWHSVEADDITGEPFFGDFAARLARRLGDRAAIIVTGGWRDLDVIERYLETTNIAGIAMSRPLICQSNLPMRWEDGDRCKAECISCNWCINKPGIPCILRKGK